MRISLQIKCKCGKGMCNSIEHGDIDRAKMKCVHCEQTTALKDLDRQHQVSLELCYYAKVALEA